MNRKYKEALDGQDVKEPSECSEMIDLLRCHLLFQQGIDPDDFGEEASFHFLKALSHLELAVTEMKLFNLKAKS